MEQINIEIINVNIKKSEDGSLKIFIDAKITLNTGKPLIVKYSDTTLAFTIYQENTVLPQISKDIKNVINNTLKSYSAAITGKTLLSIWLDSGCEQSECKIEDD